jgi:hypothetical protein
MSFFCLILLCFVTIGAAFALLVNLRFFNVAEIFLNSYFRIEFRISFYRLLAFLVRFYNFGFILNSLGFVFCIFRTFLEGFVTFIHFRLALIIILITFDHFKLFIVINLPLFFTNLIVFGHFLYISVRFIYIFINIQFIIYRILFFHFFINHLAFTRILLGYFHIIVAIFGIHLIFFHVRI